ncbi:MAG TPA: c-type cytochrome [Pyrinomonadaceae bacterium]|nr:c-type cytochrome [Pyrinomonadaceae bacterium]
MSRRSVNALKLALALATLVAVVAFGTAGVASRNFAQTGPASQPPPPPKGDATPTPVPGAPPAATRSDAAGTGRPQGGGAMAELQRMIAGREEQPAEQVFKNVQVMKGVPAGRFLRIMQMGYARSLGVNCAHCHVPGQWESDEKPTKGVAREMILMTRAINDEHLKKIKNLRSATPAVNCTTCHRGETKPALNLPVEPQRPATTTTPTPAMTPQPSPTPGR